MAASAHAAAAWAGRPQFESFSQAEGAQLGIGTCADAPYRVGRSAYARNDGARRMLM
jgi:hypothetical protein